MATKTLGESTSKRLRVSIPTADESVLTWWDSQEDLSMSIRMLIREQIQRTGYSDIVFMPVAQQPRRGRPPGSFSDSEAPVEPSDEPDAPEAALVAVPAPVEEAPASTPVLVSTSPSMLDELMNN